MKRIYLLITALMCLVACNNQGGGTAPIKYDSLMSYEDVVKAIEQLVQKGNWNENDCSTIDTKINSMRRYSSLNESENKSLKAYLYSQSCKYMYAGVDSLFKSSKYIRLDKWRRMLSYMADLEANFMEHKYIEISSPDYNDTRRLLDDYDKVSRWANASGYAKPEFLKKYPFNIPSAVAANRKKIEAESNYQTYFKGNTDLKNAMNGMQGRMEKSRVKYYDALEELVEAYVEENELTEEQALDLQLRFNALEPSYATHSQAAINRLNGFVDNYINTLIEKENESASSR